MGGSDPQPGLDNNPGIDAKIFADSHPYIANAYQGAQEAVKKVVKEMESRIEERRAEYQRLLNDPDYKEVHYNSETGGLKATHIGHNEHNPNDKTRFFDNLTQEDLEKECMDWLYSRGHKAILRNEKIFKNNGDLASCLDLELDGTLMDIASITDKDSQYGSALMGKNSQIKRAKQSSGDISDSVLLFFYEPSFFSTQKLLNDIEWYKQFAPACGSEQRIHHVYVAVRGEEKLRKYDI